MAGIGLVMVLHVGLIYALASGLAEKAIEVVQGPIEAKIIDTPPDTKRDEPPPPPPPALDKVPPPFVPPPEVTINLAPEAAPPTAITAVQSAKAVSSATPPRVDPEHPPRHPDYPPAARRMGEEGTVQLLLYVREDGTVQDTRIDKSSGSAKLDQAAAREALRSWRFVPAKNAGTAVAAWFRFAVTFRLTD
ncbi:MAG: energy transducer TonB [Parvibaculum sp.]|uniref:energy transducer TonB n=1 Tax=Parvibaculum sp. TaxID=2024848 RepID=UPI0025F5FDB0|nr:energy transducer TonB [Parvibaculum sp.]MCE9650475.1 energy transducer TonB [Parvibaculum sp.]